jgi:hypothetical protein
MGVNPTAWGYSAYDEIIKNLVDYGIPRAQIANIGDADTDVKKQSLFQKVRDGLVRVLLGSTQKMGMGTNVQKHLVALHELDAPWKPAEVEQREGRILRQGNENEEVAIYRYVTQGSFDSYMWQALENKQRFISQIMTGQNASRRAEDIGGQEMSYAEVKAIASGNPAVLTLAEADAELQRLGVMRSSHTDEQFLARRNVRELPETIKRLSERLSGLTADAATAREHADDRLKVGNRSVSWDDAMAVLGARLEALPQHVSNTHKYPLGVYRGLKFGLELHPAWAPQAYLEGEVTRQDALSREHRGPRAVLNALERLAGTYESQCASVRQDLAIAQGQHRDYEARLGAPFPHDAYLSQLTALRDQLKAGLSGAAPEASNGPPPSVSELAEKIKALKSTHAIEPAPERAGKRRSSAEEPVTARIRRRTEAIPALEPAIPAADVAAPAEEPSGQNGATKDNSLTPATAFQHRVAASVQRKERGR